MNFLLTLFFTFLIVLIVVICFVRIGTPVYRLETKNIIVLLTLVVEGKATENDWEVFLGVPIRHNEQLESIRLRCQGISEFEYIGGTGYLLTDKGIEDVKKILAELTGADV
tara:strand:- start:54428 stop:54760 length:333 start_codon:yes stop_codon:yes gene_type:complete